MMRIDIVQWQDAAPFLQRIRDAVFVAEQGVPADVERDGLDPVAAHFLASDGDTPVGCARLLPSGQIGRLAVLPQYRRRGIGARLLQAAIDQARALGHRGTFLHAQVQAVALYVRAGFRSNGAVFMEAGIPHVAMELDLGINFTPMAGVSSGADQRNQGDLGASGLAVRATPAAVGTTRINDELTMRQMLVDAAGRARRQIRIYSQQLDPFLYNTWEMQQTFSEFARRHAQTRIRILIHDATRIVQVGHRLMKLGRRLSSSIQFRKVVGEQLLAEYSYLLADETAIVFQPKFTVYSGFAQASDAVLVRQKLMEFDANWHRSVEDPDLRQFRI